MSDPLENPEKKPEIIEEKPTSQNQLLIKEPLTQEFTLPTCTLISGTPMPTDLNVKVFQTKILLSAMGIRSAKKITTFIYILFSLKRPFIPV